MSTENKDILAQKIELYREAYSAGKPLVSDAEFDQIEDRLRELEPDHPILKKVGSEASNGDGKRIQHLAPMLSLAKTYLIEDLLRWKGDAAIVGTPKIDGNSLALRYLNGKLSIAVTRGNGVRGEDVLEKIVHVADCPKRIKTKGHIEIRGELFCSEDNFEKLSSQMVAQGLEAPTNARNIVAGVLGRKKNIELAKHFGFYAFDVLSHEGDLHFTYEMEKFAWLESQGFSIPDPKRLKEDQDVNEYLEMTRKNLVNPEIGIDGAVFTFDAVTVHEEMGSTAHHPRFKMSFKWQGETAKTEITGLLWATSRLGVVTPVAEVTPVQLSGALISNVTLHNMAHVKNHNIKAGDVIEIVRSGEVIPKYLRTVQAKDGVVELPEICPSCEEALTDDDVRLICENIEGCPAQNLGRILNWIRSAGIEDLSEKRLGHLLESGLVQSIADLYRLTEDDFLKLPLTKEKMAKKLYSSISESKRLPLPLFLQGLGIGRAGKTSWEKIMDAHPGLTAIRSASTEDIMALEGFAEKSASLITEGLASSSAEIEELLELGVIPYVESKQVAQSTDTEFAGKTFVITGSFSKSRKEMEALIKSLGGKSVGAVSKSTSVLIIADKNSTSSKALKARNLGVELWSEEDFDTAVAKS